MLIAMIVSRRSSKIVRLVLTFILTLGVLLSTVSESKAHTFNDSYNQNTVHEIHANGNTHDHQHEAEDHASHFGHSHGHNAADHFHDIPHLLAQVSLVRHNLKRTQFVTPTITYYPSIIFKLYRPPKVLSL